MILIGLGANLPSATHGSPRETLEAAVREMDSRRVSVVRRSRWYRSAPVMPAGEDGSDIPWFVNGVLIAETELEPMALLDPLHAIERHFGRRRRSRWEPRVLDLDLLAHGRHVAGGDWDREGASPLPPGTGDRLSIPHPRLHLRSFVLVPLVEIAPDWVHPALDTPAAELLDRLVRPTAVFPLDD